MAMRSRTRRAEFEAGTENQLSLQNLPPPDTSRWVARRKAQVASAVQSGQLTVDEACRVYKLTLEELTAWQQTLRQFGVRGLQATRHIRRPETPWIGRHV
jgi:hypothetical protein